MARAKKLRQNMSDMKLSDHLKKINAGLQNPKFVTLAAVKILLQGKTDTLEEAIAAAAIGGKAAKGLKRIAKREVVILANQVCDDVNALAKGDYITIVDSQFEVAEDNHLPVVLEGLKSFTVSNTKTLGQVRFKAVKGLGAVSINIQWGIGNTLEEVTEWTDCQQSAGVCIVSNLPSMSRVWGRVISVGRRGQVLYSLPISTVVL